MKAPETQYAKGRDGFVAYQVIGAGPLDLVFIPEVSGSAGIQASFAPKVNCTTWCNS